MHVPFQSEPCITSTLTFIRMTRTSPSWTTTEKWSKRLGSIIRCSERQIVCRRLGSDPDWLRMKTGCRQIRHSYSSLRSGGSNAKPRNRSTKRRSFSRWSVGLTSAQRRSTKMEKPSGTLATTTPMVRAFYCKELAAFTPKGLHKYLADAERAHAPLRSRAVRRWEDATGPDHARSRLARALSRAAQDVHPAVYRKEPAMFNVCV